MLTTYRRHLKDCNHRKEGRKYRRCRCPIWADGFLGDQEIRKSLDTRDWEEAQEKIRNWEADGEQSKEDRDEPLTVERAKDDFLADAEARQLKDKTVYKYRLLFRQLEEFCKKEGIRYLKELDTATLRKFRGTWKDNGLAALKKLERMRSFFRYALESGWVKENPVTKISNPKVEQHPTLPYSHEEMVRILAACDKHIAEVQPQGKDNARRLRVLVLLLRYSGLRISDAVGCSVERLVDGKLRLYTQKTGTHVHCPLPEFLVIALAAIPRMSERHWFWTGNGKLQTAVGDWQGKLHDIFKDAEVAGGHAHRFRDTFATELLLRGVPIERVSVLLGHHSVKITERYYSPWVRERQEQAEADVRRTWGQDPVVQFETKGTLEVQ
jgi:integrase/recombinase XerD